MSDLTSILNEDNGIKGPQTFTIDDLSLKKPITAHLWRASHAYSSEKKVHIVVATHGAGGNALSSACMKLCEGLASASSPSAPLAVVAFDGSMNLKARTKGFLFVIGWAAASERLGKVTLAGRSMGCRAAAIAFSEASDETKEKLSGKLILESYPLVGKGDEARKQALLSLPDSAEILFAIGSDDEILLSVKDINHGMSLVSRAKVQTTKKEVAEILGERVGLIAGQWALEEIRGESRSGSLSWVEEDVAWSEWQAENDAALPQLAGEDTQDEESSEKLQSDRPSKRRKKG
ncbi:MAG: hypothetical protein CYPHOPRED_003254 [Cyphobasidiales sp. Tagirdzhanova-0007]|nr:MAG: hypothetical protein CYPHOPRED_003254 [Cyphobasidiales sp. Tagirdzhanova-0007]